MFITDKILSLLTKIMGTPISALVPVHGGDINDAYSFTTKGKKYFIKVNSPNAFPQMFKREAEGLTVLNNFFPLSVPTTITCGETDTLQYLILDFIEKGEAAKDFWQSFGEALAQMHRCPQSFFGWHTPNYMGSIKQINDRKDTWADFYTQMRIMPLIKDLFDKKELDKTAVNQAVALCNKAAEIFPKEAPALLHGDLWSGNFGVAKNGYATIFDPAVYNGHREMDIGLTKLFGGFDNDFYVAYNETYPLQDGWQKRLPFTQLYSLLVHALLFGGHYIGAVKRILNEF